MRILLYHEKKSTLKVGSTMLESFSMEYTQQAHIIVVGIIGQTIVLIL